MHPNQQKPNRPEDDNNQKKPDGLPPDWRRWIWPAILFLFLLGLVLLSPGPFSGTPRNQAQEITFDSVWENRDHITTIEFDSEISATGEFDSPMRVQLANSPETEIVTIRQFEVNFPPGQAQELSNYLRERGSAHIERNPPQSLPVLVEILINFAPIILLIGFFVWMSRRAQGQMNGVFGFGQSRAREYDAQTPRITFDDVAGQEAAKRELVEIVDFLREPEKYIKLGARIPRGVLLIGPPGTGKTLMARAVAGEANVAFYSIAASEFVEMFVGVGASRVRDLFKRAKDNSPSIVFIDEIDAVGRQRGAGLGGGNDEREQTLNQMLAELDGFDQSSTVIVMAATNRPDVLDPALLRPGRFDRQVTVDLPDRKGRHSILKIHTRGKPVAKEVNLDSIAGATIGFSGADLSNLANEAALNAARNNRKKILQLDFTLAFERIVLGTERPPLSNEEERQVVAYHEAGHAITAVFTPGADQVIKVTITPRGQALGVTAFMPEDDRRNVPKKYLEARLRTGLGGRIAEEIVFGEVTIGAAGDIRQVSQIARRMVTMWGMSNLGMVDYSNGAENPFLGYSIAQGRQYSEETASKIDAEVRRIIDEAYEHTYKLITEKIDLLNVVANELLESEIIERDRFLELVGMEPDKPLDTPESVIDTSEVEAVAPDPFALFTEEDAGPDDDPTPSSSNGANQEGISETPPPEQPDA